MAQRRNNAALPIALGGVLAALAMVIMCLVGLIPLATYVCPMACMLILDFVRKSCGERIAWAWWMAVSLLSVLLAPDKEAACLFLFLGFYPILRPKIEKQRLRVLIKLAVFNGSTLLMYGLLIYVMGMDQIAAEFAELGTAMLIVTLIMGNITFFLLDLILRRGLRFPRRTS